MVKLDPSGPIFETLGIVSVEEGTGSGCKKPLKSMELYEISFLMTKPENNPGRGEGGTPL